MDVCLVLTHRCNLACDYCYAGEHHREQMEDALIDRAVDLLWADGAEEAQLSFFGGEPFLRFEAMQRAVARARARADARGTRLLLQCTTNGTLVGGEQVAFAATSGMRVTVSIDGVREAHELQRPRAGGGSSFDACSRGLRALLDGGADTDAMMVASPQVVPHVYRSASWLWSEGVATVRCNLVLGAPWEASDRAELREQLWSVAAEMVARRQQGEPAVFEPFAPALRRALPASRGRAIARVRRAQVVVATGGNLYPCAPMVGEDRDGGPEATLRLGHLDDGSDEVARRVAARGAGCDAGGACACAAYLETGDRAVAGPVGLWYGRLCGEIGEAAAAALIDRPIRKSSGRRPFLIGLAAAAGGAMVGGTALLRAGLLDLPGDENSTAGELTLARLPLPEPPPEPQPQVPPEPAPEPPPPPEYVTAGAIAEPQPLAAPAHRDPPARGARDGSTGHTRSRSRRP